MSRQEGAHPGVWWGQQGHAGVGLTSARACWLRASCRARSSSCAVLASSSLSRFISVSFRDRAWATRVGCL